MCLDSQGHARLEEHEVTTHYHYHYHYHHYYYYYYYRYCCYFFFYFYVSTSTSTAAWPCKHPWTTLRARRLET